MTRLIQILVVLAVLAVAVWQWGSYGPFEITVNTPGRALDEVVVTLGFARAYGHSSASTYWEVRTGRSNEPIRFPRGFVCWCLRPSMLVSAIHPAFFSGTDSIPPATLRHIGVTRMTTAPVSTWADTVASHPAASEKEADISLGRLYTQWLTSLQTDYVPNAHPPLASVKPSVDVARRDLESLPISAELKTTLRSHLDGLEGRLRQRAIP